MKIGGRIFKLIQSQKGSVMVEAAFLYPFIIVVSVSLLFIMVSFYQMVALKTELNVIALSESGKASGIYIPQEIEEIGEVKIQRDGIYQILSVSYSRSYGDWGILKRTEEIKEVGEFVSMKESGFLRGTLLRNGGE